MVEESTRSYFYLRWYLLLRLKILIRRVPIFGDNVNFAFEFIVQPKIIFPEAVVFLLYLNMVLYLLTGILMANELVILNMQFRNFHL